MLGHSGAEDLNLAPRQDKIWSYLKTCDDSVSCNIILFSIQVVRDYLFTETKELCSDGHK